MIYGIFPCLIKNHQNIKYLRYVIARQKGYKSKAPATQIFAASGKLHIKEKLKTEIKANNNILGAKANEDLQASETNTIPSLKLNNIKEHSLPNEVPIFYKPTNKFDITIETNQAIKDSRTSNAKNLSLLNSIKTSDIEWYKQEINFRLLFSSYKSLAKYRLTGLVVLTTLAGYGMAPGIFEPLTLFYVLIGTGLMSASANAINQILEIPYDSQMARTKNRVLIRGLLTPFHALSFAICSASLGFSFLYYGTCTLTASLGVTNLLLYTGIYTPLKRCSILNTWIGSIVGAIPPLIGWSACTGTLNLSAFLLGAILYSWQFPHFNALSWNLRPDYSKAGYRMTSVIDPDLCRRTALRHSIALLGFCSLAPFVELTTWTFAIDTLPLNIYLIYCSWKFYKNADSQSSRRLFRLSLIYLPTLMLLMFLGKNYNLKNEKNKIS